MKYGGLAVALEKGEMYYRGGRVYAHVAIGLGANLTEGGVNRWGEILRAIGTHDESLETNPDDVVDPQTLCEIFGVVPSDAMVTAVTSLVHTGIDADRTDNVTDHLKLRALEALACVDIVSIATTESGGCIPRRCAQQLGNLAVAGIMLDSFADSFEDVRCKLGQFSARELSMASLRTFLGASRSVSFGTWCSLVGHSHRYGLNAHLVTKPLRVANSLRDLDRGHGAASQAT